MLKFNRFLFANKNLYWKSLQRRASIKIKSKEEPVLPFQIILGAIPVITFGLGTWQVFRLQWKLNLIEQLNKQLNYEVTELPKDLRQMADLEYRKVTLKGHFDHSKEIIMQPRCLISKSSEHSSGLFGDQSKAGALVVTPFVLSDRGYSVLVNRGWVPKNKINPNTRVEGQIEGEITLTAIIRNTEHRPQFGLKNEPQKGQWRYRDIDAMAQSVGSAPVFVDADENSTVKGGPIGGQTRINLRNDHLNYLLTWYCLSAITAWMFYKRVLPKKIV